MADLGSQQSDTFVLSISYDGNAKGAMELVTRDKTGNWVNAVDMNYGGVKNAISGPYVPGLKLGAYGYDPISRTVWAVINYNGDFAVANLDK
jgi:expansin (peptidoglycan-binding protein)